MHLVILTLPEKEILRGYVKTCPIETVRLRAHAVLMRDRRMNVADISELVFRSERTVTRWLEEFTIGRLSCLFSGHVENENAGKLTRKQKAEIRKVIGRPPNTYGIPKEFWDVPKLKEYVRVEFGVVYESNISYHYLLKFSGLSFKYPDKLSPRRNERLIRQRIKEIKKEIRPLFDNPNWMIFTSDETRLQLEAEIRRAWLVKGKRTIVRTEKSREHQNYLGFLDQRSGRCQVYEIAKGKQTCIIPVLEALVNKYPNKRVCVVWDNAACHKGKLLREKLRKGNSLERLHLIPFPPYAPDHNPIEHVWRYGKKQIVNRSSQAFEVIKQSFLSSIDQHIFAYQI
ncbi:MAG: IS630 family transposase [bacterium]|nr:IS630 family transposase [bacterium]